MKITLCILLFISLINFTIGKDGEVELQEEIDEDNFKKWRDTEEEKKTKHPMV